MFLHSLYLLLLLHIGRVLPPLDQHFSSMITMLMINPHIDRLLALHMISHMSSHSISWRIISLTDQKMCTSYVDWCVPPSERWIKHSSNHSLPNSHRQIDCVSFLAQYCLLVAEFSKIMFASKKLSFSFLTPFLFLSLDVHDNENYIHCSETA